MAKVRSWVGLDVHARSVLAVTIDGESGELGTRRLSGATSEVVEFCCRCPDRRAWHTRRGRPVTASRGRCTRPT
jgi:hypothetical protein